MDSPAPVLGFAALQPRPSHVWLWSWLIPVAAAAVLYWPALNGKLVWDDGIVQKDQLVAFHTLHDVFFFRKDIPQWGMSYYRPIVTLSYLADQALFGRNATWGPHAAVVLYHVLTTFFVWLLARQILRHYRFGEWGALVAGVVFAMHPIHSESVCWITGRSDTVAAMFMIPALVTALHYRDRHSIWALLVSPLLFMCAILSKETALSALLVLPVLFLLVPERKTSPNPSAPSFPPLSGQVTAFLRARLYWLPLFGLYAAATGAYFVLRYMAGLRDSATQAPTWRVALERTAEALTYYLIKLVVPPPQSAFPTHLPETGVVVSVLAATAVLLLVSVWLWRRGTPLLLIGLGWVLLTLPLPLVAAARTIAKTAVAERSLYIPSVGMCVLVGGLFCAGWARRMWRGPVLVLVLGLTGAFTFWTHERAQVWQDNVALWSDAIKDDPAHGTPYHELGQAYLQRNEREKALECFEKAIERYASAEGRALAWNSKGVVLMRSNPPEAARAFQKAIDERPAYATPYFNLGQMGVNKVDQDFAGTKKYNTQLLTYSQAYFAQAIKCNRLYTWAYLELGKCQSRIAVAHLMAGEKDQAREALLNARTNIATAGQLDPHGVHASAAKELLVEVDKQLEKLEQ